MKCGSKAWKRKGYNILWSSLKEHIYCIKWNLKWDCLSPCLLPILHWWKATNGITINFYQIWQLYEERRKISLSSSETGGSQTTSQGNTCSCPFNGLEGGRQWCDRQDLPQSGMGMSWRIQRLYIQTIFYVWRYREPSAGFLEASPSPTCKIPLLARGSV